VAQNLQVLRPVPKTKRPHLTLNVFSGYIIEKRISSSKSWEKVITLEPSVTQHCISNLKEKSQYFFRVYAENAIGLSEPSETDAVQLKTHACKFECATMINRFALKISTPEKKIDLKYNLVRAECKSGKIASSWQLLLVLRKFYVFHHDCFPSVYVLFLCSCANLSLC